MADEGLFEICGVQADSSRFLLLAGLVCIAGKLDRVVTYIRAYVEEVSLSQLLRIIISLHPLKFLA